jgi:hypothetical protein
MKRLRSLLAQICLLSGAMTVVAGAATDTSARRPALQIINGSSQLIDIFWLKSDSERVPNGSVAPGKDTVITTTLGHRFAIVGRDDKTTVTVASEVPVQGFRFDPQGRDGVPVFYTQFVSAHGFPIVASAKVSPYALQEAAYLVNMMLAQRPEVREAMIKSGARLCLMAYNEYTTDLPEFIRLCEEKVTGFDGVSAKDYWDARARGLGGSETDPYCTTGEENLLGYPGDPFDKECILIHEFAHNIHLRGMVNVDPTFDTRLKSTYDAAMKAGLWKGKYASVNHHEYFAVGAAGWYGHNRFNDFDHNHVHLRSQLIAYDPGLAALCCEVFGDAALPYTKPATRLTGHLAGYDPAKAPTFEWPERLIQAKAQIRAKAEARDQAANGGIQRETREISGWTVHINRELLTDNAAGSERALELLKAQLEGIVREVPPAAVIELQKVPLWISPEYPGVKPRAEYHPNAGWLREHGRDPAMAKGVEFTSVHIFEAESRRMPNFTLHELAHAYHDRVLPKGFANPEIKAAYEQAKAGGKYKRVERCNGDGKPNTFERAYAMTNPQEYFAENTEAFFSRNDYFPFTRDELKKHDPAMFALLARLWGVESPELIRVNRSALEAYAPVGYALAEPFWNVKGTTPVKESEHP